MRTKHINVLCTLVLFGFYAQFLAAGEPKPTAKNTIILTKGEPVKPQSFSRPLKFFIDKAIDRSGNPKPMMIVESGGGVFIDREPAVIVREAIEDSLQAAEVRATDAASADYILEIYVFHFGLADSSGFETFGKVDLGIIVKDPKAGKSQNVAAMGTSIGKRGDNKKRLQALIEQALQDAVRNFLRGIKLKDTIASLENPTP
jgi:hypothetical protein